MNYGGNNHCLAMERRDLRDGHFSGKNPADKRLLAYQIAPAAHDP